jgi:integrase
MRVIQRVKYGVRGQGSLIKRESSANWLFAYCVRGREHEDSTGSPDIKQARRFAKDKLEKIGADNQGGRKFQPAIAHRVRVSELLDDLVADYRLRKVKSLDQIESHLNPIRKHFGSWRAANVATEAVDAYIEDCLDADVAVATVNRRMQILGQAFRLALGRHKVTAILSIRHLPENNARQGFFEDSEFTTVVAALPEYLQDFTRFAYLTGWRSGEIKALRWAWVDREADEIRLPDSKNGHGRVMVIEGDLADVIYRREQARLIESGGGARIAEAVFHRDGEPIGDFRKAWASACIAAGLYHVDPENPERKIHEKLFHDLRRTAVRNMVRRRVPETVAMAISGHRTRAVFDRYNITSKDDLRRAMQSATLPGQKFPGSFRGDALK